MAGRTGPAGRGHTGRSRAGPGRKRSAGPPDRRGAKITGRRDLATTWWSQEWIASLEERAVTNPNRLGRGRTYARHGAVEELIITEGAVEAVVAGSRPRPYRVVISIRVFGDDEWDTVFDVIASQVGFQARFQAGEVPEDLVAEAAARGVELFPLAGELTMACSCPDSALPCKHLAAVCYRVAGALDEDPFRVLLLRGADRETVDARLRALRSAAAGDEAGTATGASGVEHAESLFAGGEEPSPGTGQTSDPGSGSELGGLIPATAGDDSMTPADRYERLGLVGAQWLADVEDAAGRARRHLDQGDPIDGGADRAADVARRLLALRTAQVGATSPVDRLRLLSLEDQLGVLAGWSPSEADTAAAAWEAGGAAAVAITNRFADEPDAFAFAPGVADLAATALGEVGVELRRYPRWITLTGRDQRLIAEPGTYGEWWWVLDRRGGRWVAIRRLHVGELATGWRSSTAV